jgi:hypothetical protein
MNYIEEQRKMINDFASRPHETVKNDCGFFNPHEWTKWEQFKQLMKVYLKGHILDSEDIWQKRKCVKCGKEQREEI